MLTYLELKNIVREYSTQRGFLRRAFADVQADMGRIRRFEENLPPHLQGQDKNLTPAELEKLTEILAKSKKNFNRLLRMRISASDDAMYTLLTKLNLLNTAHALQALKKTNVLYTQKNIKAIKTHQEPEHFGAILHLFNKLKTNHLTQSRIDHITKAPSLVKLRAGLEKLTTNVESYIPGDSIFLVFFSFLVLPLLPIALLGLIFEPFWKMLLDKVFYQNNKNIDIVLSHPKPDQFTNAYANLNIFLKTEYNKSLLQGHDDPMSFSHIMNTLHESHLASKKNNDFFSTQTNLRNINVLLLLIGKNISQNDINNIILYRDIFTDPQLNNAMQNIPSHSYRRRAIFDRMIHECRTNHPHTVRNIRRYLVDIINPRENQPGQGRRGELNNSQSTHTASIHASASASATKLKQQYKHLLPNIDQTIPSILKWANALNSADKKNNVVKRAIKRLTHPTYTHTDPASGVSTLELIALFWFAILDMAKQEKIEMKDGIQRFRDGLYECQREYNLNETGEDLFPQDKDQPACTAGTFNKLLEKLQGIHPAVKLEFISPILASTKLKIVAMEEALSYLNNASHPKTAEQYQLSVQIFANTENDGMSYLWRIIKPAVEKRIRDEFGSLYKNKQTAFRELIDCGQWISVEVTDEHRKNLLASPGYTQTCHEPLRNNGLFAEKVPDHLEDDLVAAPVKSYRVN